MTEHTSSPGENIDIGTNVGPTMRGVTGWKMLLAIIAVATLANALVATGIVFRVKKNNAMAQEAARPAEVDLVKIIAPDCNDCFDPENAITDLKQQAVAIGEETTFAYDSPEAQALIGQYGIKKIPTYILTGETAKENVSAFLQANGTVSDGAFVFTSIPPIFIDPESKQHIGAVTAIALTDKDCDACLDLKQIIESYRRAGIIITDQKEIAWDSPEGKELITLYGITALPTLVFSTDMAAYPVVQNAWADIGTVEDDGRYVLRNIAPPYRDVASKQVKGLVDVIYLVDANCGDCYQPEQLQRNILTRAYGVVLGSERTVDVGSAEGKQLLQQYAITQVPTIILSTDAGEYTSLGSVWSQVGTVENDGSHIFRQMTQLGAITYRDLTDDRTVRPAQSNNP